MTKRFALAILAAVMVLGLSSCKCTAAKNSVAQIEATHELVSKMLLEYVEKDASLGEPEKARRRTLVQTDGENIKKLKAALED